MQTTTIVLALLGALLLLGGRRLFWLFVGVMGFAAGLQAVPMIAGYPSFAVLWVVGLIGGILGALLALFFQHVAIAVGGFLAGAVTGSHLMQLLGYHPSPLIALIGGLVGTVALILLFDWALMVLSSVVGAALIIDALGLQRPLAPLLFMALAAAGIIVQARLPATDKKRPRVNE
jgi:hypothetical protein